MIDERVEDSNVLDREGDWILEKMGTYGGSEDPIGFLNSARYVSLVKHLCSPDTVRPDGEHYSTLYRAVVYPDATSKCWRCAATIPEKIVVLWYLHNWEQVQYRQGV